MLAYSWRRGQAPRTNAQKSLRMPNHPETQNVSILSTITSKNVHRLPPLALNDIKINVVNEMKRGLTTAVYDRRISPSNLLASNTYNTKLETKNSLNNLLTWNIKIGITKKVYPNADLKLDRLCWALTSGVLNKMAAKMMVYSTPTNDKHITIHSGTNTTSQDQLMNPSKRRARKMNCSTFTAQKSSSWNTNFHIHFTTNLLKRTSNDLSCLTAQMHTAMLTIDMKISGIKTRIHKCLFDSSLSHTSSSNINNIKCNARDISIDL